MLTTRRKTAEVKQPKPHQKCKFEKKTHQQFLNESHIPSMNGDEQGSDVSFKLIILNADLRGGFIISEHHLSLPVLEMYSTNEVNVDARIGNVV